MTLKQLFRATLDAPYLQIPENAASYYAERRGDALFLFFEKSNGATDWKNNLDFPAAMRGEGDGIWFAHRGFLRVFKTVEPRIKDDILSDGVKKIVISGYSHGAALALLAHEYCVRKRPDLNGKIVGFGFGCPRVVWGLLRRKIAARFKRFTVVRNCRDLVTHLPPCFLGYRHVGNLLCVGTDRTETVVDSHRPENYLEALTAEVQDEFLA